MAARRRTFPADYGSASIAQAPAGAPAPMPRTDDIQPTGTQRPPLPMLDGAAPQPEEDDFAALLARLLGVGGTE